MTTDATRRRRRPRPYAVVASAVALFLVLLTLLAWQLRTGRDPAIGAGRAVAQAPQAGQVVVRRVVRRVVVVRPAGEEDDDGGSASARSVTAQPATAPARLATRAS